jgi:hypothetical protein
MSSYTLTRPQYVTQPLGPVHATTDQYRANLDMNFHVRFVLQAGEGGVWAVSTDPSRTVMPQFDGNGHLIAADGTQPPGEYGAFVQGKKMNDFWKAFGNADQVRRSMTDG